MNYEELVKDINRVKALRSSNVRGPPTKEDIEDAIKLDLEQ